VVSPVSNSLTVTGLRTAGRDEVGEGKVILMALSWASHAGFTRPPLVLACDVQVQKICDPWPGGCVVEVEDQLPAA